MGTAQLSVGHQFAGYEDEMFRIVFFHFDVFDAGVHPYDITFPTIRSEGFQTEVSVFCLMQPVIAVHCSFRNFEMLPLYCHDLPVIGIYLLECWL